MRRLKWIVLLVLVAAGGWYGARHLFATEETRLRRQIAAMERAVEKGNFLALQSAIASDYSDDRGLDKETLVAAVRAYRLQYGSMFIHLSDLTTELDGDSGTARVVLIAKVLATPRAGGGESELFSDRFRLAFRKQEGQWQLTRAEIPELKFE